MSRIGLLVYVLVCLYLLFFFFFSSRRRHTRFDCDWSSDVCSSDLAPREMKSTIMSFWNLTVTVGNLITAGVAALNVFTGDRKSTRLNSSHSQISYAVFCLKKKKKKKEMNGTSDK